MLEVKTPVLYIFSGLPGSGKSTLAKRLARAFNAAHIRMDSLEQGLRDCGFKEIHDEGYRLAYLVAKDILSSGCDVIADSVNPLEITRRAWIDVATAVGSNFKNIEVICSDEKEHRHRAENREDEIKNFIHPTWEEIISRDYESWSIPRIQINTAGKAIEESLKELLSAL